MQENWFELARAFSADKESVLATIIETRGATYQKVGTMMHVSTAGECTGLLSGGCLEADIALHSQQVLSENKSKVLHYDLIGDADLLWGLGGGCEGEIKILLQPMTPANQHLGFADVLTHALDGKSGNYFQQTASGEIPIGYFISTDERVERFDQQVTETAKIAGKSVSSISADVEVSSSRRLINIPVYPPISILVCGAGPDAVPVVQFAKQLGWQVALWDHRQASLDKSLFGEVNIKRKIRAEQISSSELDLYDAIVIMTHNLENDQHYLKNAIASSLPYIGVLGPAARRDKLLENISEVYGNVDDRVFGPIGLDLGGRSPQAIALSIMAEIQQQLTKFRAAQNEKPLFMDIQLNVSITK
ncbi:XdhC family protein [Thalassotalea atypica]|uniref:XdhC family protein n=1 Tax=Thalassotalea atypica TaxID=2054316 RepID=UPI002572E4C5|nr:XdhC/CoxI family protein [Thalassotalea atypica]